MALQTMALQQIEDWESYAFPRPRNGQPLQKPVKNIDVALRATLAGDFKAKEFDGRLNYIFKSWRQLLDASAKGIPRLLAPLLNQKDASLNKVTALAAADKLKIASIAPAAKAYGFDLHLVRAEYHKSRMVQSCGYSDPLGRYRARCSSDMYDYMDDDDLEDFDADEVEMPEDDDEGEQFFHFGAVCTLDGCPMKFTGLIFDEGFKGDTFLGGKFEDGERTAELSVHGYDAGELTHVYTRVAILITPVEQTKSRIVPGEKWMDFACDTLSTSISKRPTARETKFKTALMEHTSSANRPHSDSGAFRALRKAAERWNLVALFAQVCQNCPSGSFVFTFEVDGLVSAYKKFGWKGVKSLYTIQIPKEANYRLRAEAIAGLFEAAKAQNDTLAVAFFAKERDLLLEGVQTLEPWVADLILTTNDPGHYLFNSIFSRLNASSAPPSFEVWTKLFEPLRTDGGTLPAAQYAGLTKSIKSCILTKVQTLPAFPASRDWGGGERPSTDPIFSAVQIAVRFEAFDSLSTIFSSMRKSAVLQTSEHPRAPAAAYYKTLIPKVASLVKNAPALGKHFVPFFDDALPIFLPTVGDDPDLFNVIIQYSGSPLEVADVICSPERVKELARSKKHDFLQSLARLFAHSPVLRQNASSETASILLTLTKRCFVGMIHALDLKPKTYSFRTPQTIALEDIRFAFDAAIPTSVGLLLGHLLASPAASEPEFIRATLAGVLQVLPDELARHKASIAEPAYRDFASETVKRFVRLILGPKPVVAVSPDDLKTASCGCFDCRHHFVPFFESDRSVVIVKAKQSTRTHLEKQLAKVKAESWGVTWKTVRTGSPHTLQVRHPVLIRGRVS
ncbi:hypothetical protein C8R46DRAFT_1079363 [Mycena filopes]|nr:hypothetical protein C8R46DRAFT_1079363 [Mycena filopes]